MLAGKLVIEFDDHEPLACPINASWKVSATAEADWNAPDFDDSHWSAAAPIAKVGQRPWGTIAVPGANDPPLACPLVRKEFRVPGAIRRATIYGSALGFYRLWVNGEPVGNDYFTPGWTDYKKRVYYQTYDVTALVRPNAWNAVGGVLAGGWYYGAPNWLHYGDRPRLLAQLEIELADGTVQTIATDGSWQAAFGPYIEAGILAGETYDATKEIPGWAAPGVSAGDWRPVAVADAISAKLQAFPSIAEQETGELTPVKITEPAPGVFVFDLGQNFAGFARLEVRGPAGTKVVLRFAEMLNPDGTIYTANLGSAWATDTYVLKGEGEETWQPQFTYHGFRYVEVTGYPGRPTADAITGIAVNSNIRLDRLVRVLQPDGQPALSEHRLDTAGELHLGAHRLPATRRAAGLDGRRGDVCPGRRLQCRRGGVSGKMAGRSGRRPGAGGRFSRRGPARRVRRRHGRLGRRRYSLPHDALRSL